MSEQSDVVDFVSQTPSGDVVLTVSDHLPWGPDGEHLLLLQEKLNTYLRFLESGEVYERFPTSRGKSFLLNVVCLYRPDSTATAFLGQARVAVEGAGFNLGWSPLNGAYSDDN